MPKNKKIAKAATGAPSTAGPTGPTNGKSGKNGANGRSAKRKSATPAPAARPEKKPASRDRTMRPVAVAAPVPPAAPAGPRWPKGGPSKADLRRYRQRLLELRRNLILSSKSLAAEALKASGQDFSVDHMADHGTDNYEQDFNLQLLEGESEQLANIREALLRIDGKSEPPFGLCEACQDDPKKLCDTCPWIPPSRLDVLPHARLCVPTKEIEERTRGT